MTPGAGPFLSSGTLVEKNFAEVYLVMLDTIYQGSGPYGFRQEDFFSLNKPICSQ